MEDSYVSVSKPRLFAQVKRFAARETLSRALSRLSPPDRSSIFCVKGWPTCSESSHVQLGPRGMAQELDSVTTQRNSVTEQLNSVTEQLNCITKQKVAIGKDVVDEVERQNWKRDTKLDHRNRMAKCNNSKLNYNGVLQFVIIKWRISTS